MMYTMVEIDKYTISQILSMGDVSRAQIESIERGVVISARQEFGFHRDRNWVSNNDNVTLLYKSLNDFFLQQLRIHKTELDANANNILLCPCSNSIYKFILVLFKDQLIDNTTYQTILDKIAICTDTRLDLSESPTGLLSNQMFQNINGVLSIKAIVVDKTTYNGGIYDGTY